ncbi:calmodulin binding transcription activator 1 [Pyrus ussuriensis x Pyrus communis]|uniref:Calmodulin binding transcription activator 1 n=1 Tax=Pyrus ussuriensis x Pyrus communis TaxID=2448454 RepID=A0A5N5GB91_9ROSA|nr:calmodulin binding transcription activator 1 [Pyrus ussuriensis x Pyrus communis]
MDSNALFTDMAFEVPWEQYKNHNFVIHEWNEMVYDDKNWIGLNTGSFLLKNYQWSLDILDVWALIGPKGKIRDEVQVRVLKELGGFLFEIGLEMENRGDYEVEVVFFVIYPNEKCIKQYQERKKIKNHMRHHWYHASTVLIHHHYSHYHPTTIGKDICSPSPNNLFCLPLQRIMLCCFPYFPSWVGLVRRCTGAAKSAWCASCCIEEKGLGLPEDDAGLRPMCWGIGLELLGLGSAREMREKEREARRHYLLLGYAFRLLSSMVNSEFGSTPKTSPNMKNVHIALGILAEYHEWRWLLSPLRREKCGLPPHEEIRRIKGEAFTLEAGKRDIRCLIESRRWRKSQRLPLLLARPSVPKSDLILEVHATVKSDDSYSAAKAVPGQTLLIENEASASMNSRE